LHGLINQTYPTSARRKNWQAKFKLIAGLSFLHKRKETMESKVAREIDP